MFEGPVPATQSQDQAAEDLRVGGLTRLTTIDYPGELAAVVFCQGCPWRCRYCHNHHLWVEDSASRIPWSEVMAFLQRRFGLLDAVVFSGGEPTAQGALPKAMQAVKALGYKIGLHTSGAYPRRLQRILPLLNWVGLDIKALPEDYPEITGIPGSGELAWESLGILLRSGIALEVRTTLMPTWTPESMRALSERLAETGVRRYAIQVCALERARDRSLPPYLNSPQDLISAVDPRRFEHLEIRGL